MKIFFQGVVIEDGDGLKFKQCTYGWWDHSLGFGEEYKSAATKDFHFVTYSNNAHFVSSRSMLLRGFEIGEIDMKNKPYILREVQHIS